MSANVSLPTQFLLESLSIKSNPFSQRRQLINPQDYFSLSKLKECIANPMITPDWIQVTLQGKALTFDDDFLWKFVQKRKLCFIDKSRMNQAIDQGASIVLEGLDILDERLHALCTEIDNQLPCALINCEAFFSQKNNEAYAGHRDSDDVLVIQLEGAKRWRIHEPQQRRYRGNSPLNEAQMGPLVQEVVMEPGDVLFVRAGVPHRCITESSYSLHLSLDLCDRTPNIEEITQIANQRHAECLAPMHANTDDVVAHYINHLNSQGLRNELLYATSVMRQQATKFRSRMGQTRLADSLTKFTKTS